MTIHSDGWPEMGVRVAFGFTHGLVPGALNWITSDAVLLSVLSVAVKVSEPWAAERTVKVVEPVASVVPEVGVILPMTGLPATAILLPDRPLPLESLIEAINDAVVM